MLTSSGQESHTPSGVWWDALETLISPEKRDQLARVLTEAMQLSWGEVRIEIRDHELHAIAIERSELLRKDNCKP